MKYKDRSLFGKRGYELLDAAVHVSGTTSGGSRFEAQIDYAELNPTPEKIWLRSPLMWGGIAITSMATISLTALGVFQSQDKEFLTGLAYAMAFIGLFVALISLKKIELARFKSRAGVASLDIFRSGPDKLQFDAFVTELKNRIRNGKEPNQ